SRLGAQPAEVVTVRCHHVSPARRGFARRRARARVEIESAAPERAARAALLAMSRPDAREKLIAMSLPTPSVSRMAAVAPTLTASPPAVIGTTPAAALRQSTHRPGAGQKARARGQG